MYLLVRSDKGKAQQDQAQMYSQHFLYRRSIVFNTSSTWLVVFSQNSPFVFIDATSHSIGGKKKSIYFFFYIYQ